MKKLILIIGFILSVAISFAQNREVDATVLIVRDSAIMTGGKVTDMAALFINLNAADNCTI